jgi:mannose-6-phosphate isomerase-like protein (cupin superfamily)
MSGQRLRGQAFFGLLGLSLCVLGCTRWSERGAKGVGTLPPASANETRFSPYQPAHAYQQLAKGLLGRRLYTAPPELGTPADVHDLLVGPNQRSENYTFEAAAIFEVKSGNGILSLGEKQQRIETGRVLSLPPAQPFSIENQSDIAIAIRVELLGGK